MDLKNNTDQDIAAHLAHPFMLPGQSGQPLSFRCLPDGGMVVIAQNGRKMWFTALEVCRARKEMKLPPQKPPANPSAVILKDLDPNSPSLTSQPPGRMREGESVSIALPESLKHLRK